MRREQSAVYNHAFRARNTWSQRHCYRQVNELDPALDPAAGEEAFEVSNEQAQGTAHGHARHYT